MAKTSIDDWPPIIVAQRWYRNIFTPQRLGSARFMVCFWFAVRIITFAWWGLAMAPGQFDVVYYHSKIMALDIVGPEYTMPEYPTPVLWFLYLPRIMGFGTSIGYLISFACLMMALDAVFTVTLWRTGGRFRGPAITFWNVFIFFVGPIAYLRFDLVTSVLTGWALINVQRRRSLMAGALVGAGAALKLWPALMWPALLGGRRKGNLAATVGVFGTGGLLALGSLLWGGWARLVSPLGWQSDRGLQIESIWATLPMALRGLGIGEYHVAISRYQAYEIWGPGVNFWLGVASKATAVGVVAAVIFYVVWWLRPASSRRVSDSVALMLLVVLIMIVANKTFSPQYIQWIGGPLAAGIVIAGLSHENPTRAHQELSRLKRMSVALLVLTLLTQLIFPIGYSFLLSDNWSRIPVTVILVMRNVGMVWLLGRVVGWVWKAVRPLRAAEAGPTGEADRDDLN